MKKFFIKSLLLVLLAFCGTNIAFADYWNAGKHGGGFKVYFTRPTLDKPYIGWEFPNYCGEDGKDDALKYSRWYVGSAKPGYDLYITNPSTYFTTPFHQGAEVMYMERTYGITQRQNEKWGVGDVISGGYPGGSVPSTVRINQVAFYPGQEFGPANLQYFFVRWTGWWDVNDNGEKGYWLAENEEKKIGNSVDGAYWQGPGIKHRGNGVAIYTNIAYDVPATDQATFTRYPDGKIEATIKGNEHENWTEYYGFSSEQAEVDNLGYYTNNYGTVKLENGKATFSLQGTFNETENYTIYYHQFYKRSQEISGQTLHHNDAKTETKTVNQHFQASRTSTVVKGFMYPSNLQITQNKWDNSVKLTWEINNKDNNHNTDGGWLIFRQKVGENNIELLTGNRLNNGNSSYTDNGIESGAEYTYWVTFAPTSYGNVTAPIDSKLSCKTNVKHDNTFNFSDVNAELNDGTTQGGILLTWTPERESSDIKFYVQRWDEDREEWVNLNTTPQTATSYLDTDVVSMKVYRYRIKTSYWGIDLLSEEKPICYTTMTTIKGLTASQGTYSNMVKLSWDVAVLSKSNTRYVLSRKLLGDQQAVFTKIYETVSNESVFYYEDISALPGQFYDYKVTVFSHIEATDSTESKWSEGNSKEADGFVQARGIITGRIKYGTGTAVQGAKVILSKNDNEDMTKQFYSLYLNGEGTDGLVWKPVAEIAENYFVGNRPWSVQFYIRPESDIAGTQAILDINGYAGVAVTPAGDGYELSVKCAAGGGVATNNATGIVIPADAYTHIVFSYNGTSAYTLRTIARDTENVEFVEGKQMKRFTGKDNVKFEDKDRARTFVFGTSGFKGYVDEIRVWSKELTDQEIIESHNRTLTCTESNLLCYWPMDEGISGLPYAYDYSKNNGIANGNHAAIKESASISEVTPTVEQLSLYGLTDENGNYIIRGVPFSGDGTTYIVRPVMGIHEFSPSYHTRYLSSSSITHDNVAFEDISSFPVSGTVYYENTTYPVQGCNLYVDGNVCTLDGNVIETDEYGRFEISVPIGDHYISIEKNGHTFANNGRYPTGVGTTQTFEAPISNLTFYDNTLVNVAGRVVGGDIEGNQSVGFGLSNNNIGVAQFVLTPTNDIYSLNVVKKVNGTIISYENNGQELVCETSADNINSSAWRGSGDNAGKIFIKTDARTGEFSALIPPLTYNVSAPVILSKEQTICNPGIIDISNPLSVASDTLVDENGVENIFEYNAKYNCIYYSEPNFIVTQSDREDGLFGIEEYKTSDDRGEFTVGIIDNVHKSYNYGMPLFIQGDPYTFNLKGYEQYSNYDSGTEVITTVPLKDCVVTISNALSDGQTVLAEKDEEMEDEEIEVGDVVNLENNQLTLDENGEATYKWWAGFANTTAPYSRTISITYETGGQINSWKLDGKEYMEGIILGELPSGSNFVTMGPDRLVMVLRDPPGTGSSATWSKGTITAYEKNIGHRWTTDNTIKVKKKFNVEITTLKGLGVLLKTSLKVADEFTTGIKVVSEGENANTTSYSITTSESVSTSSDPAFVGSYGDLFIGYSTNQLFGQAREVGFTRDLQDNYTLGVEEIISVGSSFNTYFTYSQYYIQKHLLPNLKDLRNRLLVTLTEEEYNNYENDTDEIKFITKLQPDDPNFGSNNNDKTVWGDQAAENGALEGPSYKVVLPERLKTMTPVDLIIWKWENKDVEQDSIRMYNTQIANWIKHLASNEEAKVKAWENREKNLVKNYSFVSGSNISYSYETDTTYVETHEHSSGGIAIFGNVAGFELNSAGWEVSGETETGGKRHRLTTDTDTEKATFSFTFAEDDDDEALSVDVYKGGTYGYIFRTRGGQTSKPYEDEEYTKYYEPGKHKLHEKTIQIEIPDIEVETATATNLPSGSAASYILQLSNKSEIDDVYYDLILVEESNPNGAQIRIDGMPLTDKRTIKIDAGAVIKKTLYLTQSNPGILDYENIGIALVSCSQGDPTAVYPVIADTAYISAHYVPSSSPVKMELNRTLLNSSSGASLEITFNNFDRYFYNQKAFRIQYMKQGDTDWTLLKEYLVNADKNQQLSSSQALLPESANVTYSLDMSSFADGKYTFRILSASTYGNGECTLATDGVEVRKDMARPMVFGTPKPATGILGVGDDIEITFNENINSGRLTSTGNFLVTAALNGDIVAHDIAMMATGSEEAVARTEANINLIGKSFAVDMWIRISGEGTIFRHGNGTNKIALGIKEVDGEYHFAVNGDVYGNPLPADKWIYLAFNLDQEHFDGTCFTALYADDTSSEYLAVEKPIERYEGNGIIALGEGFTGAIHEVALWDKAIDVDNLQAQMHESKHPATEHLIGYWKLNEGTGTQAKDFARNRHMNIGSTSWYLNNKNKALELVDALYAENDALVINLSECPAKTGDDYMIEMWFRAEEKQDDEVVYLFDSDALATVLENGKMKLYAGDKVVMSMGNRNYNDNKWHHLAINVLRNGNTTVYVDGEATGQVASANVPALQTTWFYFGANYIFAQDAFLNKMRGAVDELRVWNATVNASVIRDRMNVRLKGDEAGLVAYYPFEEERLDEYSQIVTAATAIDMVTKRHEVTARNAAGHNVAFTDEAPSLKPVLDETNVNYNFVASERGIVIELNEDADRLEGTKVNITVKDVLDLNGNKSQPVTWTALVKRNQLLWFDDEINVTGRIGEEKTFTATVTNQSAQPEHWILGDLPSWLSANFTSGSLPALGNQEITFTVDASAPTGKSEFTVYVSGNSAIPVPLTVNMNLKAQAPDWSVEPSDFESSATLFGAVMINVDGKVTYSEDEDDLVAAFIDGECVGVTNVQYEDFSDSYRAYLNIYGNGDDTDKSIELKVWDASTGIVHPVVKTFDNTNADVENDKPETLTYQNNTTWGDFDQTYLVFATSYVQQSTQLKKNWNWISVYVNNRESNNAINSVLSSINPYGIILKNSTAYSEYITVLGKWDVPEENGGNIEGCISHISSESMYKLQMSADATLVVDGEQAAGTDIGIRQGWNWIPYTRSFTLSVDDALASAEPARNDQIKGQEGYAMYNGTAWSGTLKSLTPGKGYLYKHCSETGTSISYPTQRNIATSASAPARRYGAERMFTAIAPTEYESNMTLLAVVKDGDDILENVQEVAVFNGTVCLATAIMEEDGFFYLTIPGNKAVTDRLSLVAVIDGNIVETSTSLYFGEDVTLGDYDAPFEVTLGHSTAIGRMLTDESYIRMPVVDLSGRVFYTGAPADFNENELKDGQYIFEFFTADGRAVCYKQLIRRLAE